METYKIVTTERELVQEDWVGLTKDQAEYIISEFGSNNYLMILDIN
tara:strand:- start:100 stop:237 length:138 start_codon:yes stop_codon:yes gene_type:complete